MVSGSTKRPGLSQWVTAAFRGGPLALRDFRLLSLGQLASTVGDFCYAVALPWLILSSKGGTVLLGTVLACYGIPRTVLIPLGGVLADKISPRAVMLAADAVRCVLVAALAVIAARALVSLAFLGPVAALIGAGEGLFLPASAAIMPTLLPAESLQAGNGLFAAMIQIGSFGGPVLGGILVTTTGSSAAALAVDAASFGASAVALALMRRHTAVTSAPPGDATSVDGEPAEAEPARARHRVASEETSIVRLFLHARVLQVIVLVAVLANFVISGAFEVGLPTLAHARFGAPGYGALIACFGVGSFIGTLAAAQLGGLRRPAIAACAGFVAGGLALASLPFLGGLAGAAAAAAVFGALANFGNVIIITLLQRWAPARLLGRVMSLVMLASIGAFPVSVALSGVIVRHIGPAPFFPASGTVLALAVLLAVTQRQFRQFGMTSASSEREEAVAA